jgi:hypothetical protein
MAQLSTKIKLYAAANGVASVDFTSDVMLQDDSDGNGAYIKEWNLDIAQPTDAQLAEQETSANTEEANNEVKATRKSLYGSWESQLEEIYDDGIDSWKARIQQIKTDNPKE